MKKLNLIFFGTPDFSVPSLDMLYNHPHVNISYVVSMPDRKSGRGQNLSSPEVIDFAKKNKIPFFQTENINKEQEFLTKIKNLNIDCFIVLAFAQFLSDSTLEIPKQGAFNIHTSLLPKYRGAAPIQYALLNGDKSTGVSIQRMVKKMDAGDICLSQEVCIDNNETGGQLYTKLKFQAALSLNNFIYQAISNQLTFSKQNEDNISFAPTLKREDGFLNFKIEKAQDIANKINALHPWPGTYCFFNQKRLKVFSVTSSHYDLAPGEISIKHNELHIGCQGGAINILELQLEGKKRCSANILLNGYKKEIKINPEV